MAKKVSVTSITPTLFYNVDGEISRTLDRLDWHLKSLKLQRHIKLRMLVIDQSQDEDIIAQLQKICLKYGAEYYNIKTNLIFNKSLLINYGLHLTKSEFVAILDLDLVFQHHVFWRCYLKYEESGVFSNTGVYYLDKKDSLNAINLSSDKSFKLNRNKHTGKFVFPKKRGYGIQGGIQFLTTKFAIDILKGCNTDLNLLGGYDNDIVMRSIENDKNFVQFYPSQKKIFSLHIPHVKKRNFYNMFKNDSIIQYIRNMNKQILLKRKVKNFVYKEERVIGFRIIEGNVYYGRCNNALFLIHSVKSIKRARGYFSK